MQSRAAAGQTVFLHVDHAEESYYVEFTSDWLAVDWTEVYEYMNGHGFEAMDDGECPAEFTDDGSMIIWVANRKGERFVH